MEYKIAKVLLDKFYYFIVGREHSKKKWRILCDKSNYNSGNKLKTLYNEGCFNHEGEINDKVVLSKTLSTKQIINLFFKKLCNCTYFYGLGTLKIINGLDGDTKSINCFNYFISDSFFLRLKSDKEDSVFEFNKNETPNLKGDALLGHLGAVFNFDDHKFVAIDLSNVYPVIHTSILNDQTWFEEDGCDKNTIKDVSVKDIVTEIRNYFNVKVHNINGSGTKDPLDPIIFQFKKAPGNKDEFINKKLKTIFEKYGKVKDGNCYFSIDDKYLFWISHGTLAETMPSQLCLKFSIGKDSYNYDEIEPEFANNQIINEYLFKNKLSFSGFLNTDFAKENKNLEFNHLIQKLKVLSSKEEKIPTLPEIKNDQINGDTNDGIVEIKMEKSESKKSEIKAAAMRSIAKKTIDLSAIFAERTAAKLAKSKPTRDTIKKVCQMPIVKNIFGVGVGYALPVIPVIGVKPITKEIAEEIRIEGMSGVADATIGPLMELFDSMMEKMPTDEVEEKKRIEDSSSSEIEQNDYCEEENVQRKNRS